MSTGDLKSGSKPFSPVMQILNFIIGQAIMVVDLSLKTAIKVAGQVVKLLKEAIKLLG